MSKINFASIRNHGIFDAAFRMENIYCNFDKIVCAHPRMITDCVKISERFS